MSKNSSAPIGFFDSGVGGLSVLKHAIKELPDENFVFYGDSANAPYGTKTGEEIQELSMKCASFLYGKGVKLIVIACNTATSASVYQMREEFRLPVISIEPAVKPAHLSGNEGKIIVMATPATIAGARYRALVERVGCEDKVIHMPCGGLVELIETGDFDSPAITDYLREKFEPLRGTTVGGIVIGCTHYSFIAKAIEKTAGEFFEGKKEIFDGMYGTVRQLRRVLESEGILSEGPGGKVDVYTSDTEETLHIYKQILAK